MRLRRGDHGLTLLELVVAVLVLSLGSIAALRALDGARLSIGAGSERVLASLAATNRAEELRLLGTSGSLPEQVSLAGRPFVLSTQEQATAGGLRRVEVRARSPGGPGAIRVIYLAPVAP